MKKLLVDGDIVIYQTAVVFEDSFDFGDFVGTALGSLEEAQVLLDSKIEELMLSTSTSEAIICLTSKDNFRYDVLPTYKHNRKDKKRPELLQPLREYVEKHYNVITKPRLEADDVLGILATKNPNRYIIASIDKDLLQIPGVHYNWNNDELVEVSEEEGELFFYTQVLTGDSVDGYKGCPGIGKVKAFNILKDTPHNRLWTNIVQAYRYEGLTEEDALQQARVARILTIKEWDTKKRCVKLWQPPKLQLQYEIVKCKGNWRVHQIANPEKHCHVKKYDDALKLLKAAEGNLNYEKKPLKFLESLARIIISGGELDKLIAVRRQKGKKQSYVNSKKK